MKNIYLKNSVKEDGNVQNVIILILNQELNVIDVQN